MSGKVVMSQKKEGEIYYPHMSTRDQKGANGLFQMLELSLLWGSDRGHDLCFLGPKTLLRKTELSAKIFPLLCMVLENRESENSTNVIYCKI